MGFPGFGKVFAEVNKIFDTDDESVNQQCWLTYEYLREWYKKEPQNLPKANAYSLLDDVRQLLNFVDWILESNIQLCDKRCLMKDIDTEVGNVRTNSCNRETCPEFVLKSLVDNVRIEYDRTISRKMSCD